MAAWGTNFIIFSHWYYQWREVKIRIPRGHVISSMYLISGFKMGVEKNFAMEIVTVSDWLKNTA